MLIGDLGTGKTTLAKGIVEALGAAPADDVLSPTFSLVHEYEGDPKVYHLDLYRLDTVPELETLGLEDIWEERAVVIIEWGERFDSQLPGDRLEIRLEHDGDDSRIIRLGGERAP
jgi:tRNA threonylcarbamoyladenosine biosynthesis protein TsaE